MRRAGGARSHGRWKTSGMRVDTHATIRPSNPSLIPPAQHLLNRRHPRITLHLRVMLKLMTEALQ